jgi:hypothetical protein
MSDRQKKQTLVPDFSTISFPSDRITIGQIRQEQPDTFAEDGLFTAHATYFLAISTVLCEQGLAKKAWAAALGQPDPEPNEDRLEQITMLNDDYVRYGLSTGIAKTREMVREFEKAVAKQALKSEGKGR